MKKIFLDANVLISVLNREYPLFLSSSRVLSLSDRSDHILFTSPLCLAISFYFACKKCGAELALKKIALLSEKLQITLTGPEEVKATLLNKSILDFEDGLEYYSAMEANCTAIITEDTGDFYFSSIPVVNCTSYLKEYITPIKK